MSGKKKNAAKESRRQSKQLNPMNWEHEWIEKVLPAIKEFASQAVRLRFKHEIAREDQGNWRFGSDIDIKHDQRRVIITEFFVPLVDGKPMVYLDDGSLNPGMLSRKFSLRYDHLQEAARHASQTGNQVNLARYYLPEVTVVKGEPGWEAKFEENNLRGQEIIFKALDRMADCKRDLILDNGEESDEGKYIGLTLAYNSDENLLQLVTHTKQAMDVVENKDGEINYIDLADIEIDGLALEGWDNNALNIRSAVARLAAEHRTWVRIVKPSKDAYKRFSGELADHIMGVVDGVYKRAQEGLPEGAVVMLDQAPETGLLKASYIDPNPSASEPMTDEATGWTGTTQPVVDIELSRADGAAVLMIAGRIEPDMWFHVDYEFKARFNAKYGNGSVTILETVI